ncbi:MAG: Csu type fimbrial protein [Janthinobacterium lividum]
MSKNLFLARIVLAAVGMFAAADANAVTTVTATMLVTGTTVNACIVTTTPLAFATLNLIGTNPNDAQSTVVVTCTPGTAYNVGLDNGLNFSTLFRHMKSATTTAMVQYALYSDSIRSTPWGATIGTNTVAGTAVVLPTTLTVYGRVPAATTPVAADAYLDTITVTLTY